MGGALVLVVIGLALLARVHVAALCVDLASEARREGEETYTRVPWFCYLYGTYE